MSVTGKIQNGIPTVVFNRTAAGSGATFSTPMNSRDHFGVMILQAIGFIGAGPGTITALVVDLEISMDNEVTWNKLVTGITLTSLAVAVTIAGGGGGPHYRLTSTTFTLGTATSIQIYANAG